MKDREDRVKYIFFCNKFKYQGYIISRDQYHITIHDTFKDKEIMLPMKETVMERIYKDKSFRRESNER